MHRDILTFWFDETDPKLWWSADPNFDALIRRRFLPLMQRAACAELHGWRATASGRLAEIILLDQFPRNVYRNTPQAFAHDPQALVLAQEAVAAGALTQLGAEPRGFLLLPYMHSESRQIQAESVALHRAFASASSYDFALRHQAIIDRFGRYPHRNVILGRTSTAEELAFLEQPGSRF
jgi:uncharacterized protein (DUF924 family)